MEANKKEIKLRVLTTGSDKLTVSVYKSGNLVFSAEAVKKLGITKDKFITLAAGENNEFYISIKDKKDETSIPIHFASKHFYANTKKLFQAENLSFAQGAISFKLGEEIQTGSVKWIQLTRDEKSEIQNTKIKGK